MRGNSNNSNNRQDRWPVWTNANLAELLRETFPKLLKGSRQEMLLKRINDLIMFGNESELSEKLKFNEN